MLSKYRIVCIVASIFVAISLLFDVVPMISNMHIIFKFGFASEAGRMFVSIIIQIVLIVFMLMNKKFHAFVCFDFLMFIDIFNLVSAINESHFINFNIVGRIICLVVDVIILFILLQTSILSDQADEFLLKFIWFIPAILVLFNAVHDIIFWHGLFDIKVIIQQFFEVLAYLSIGFWASGILEQKENNL